MCFGIFFFYFSTKMYFLVRITFAWVRAVYKKFIELLDMSDKNVLKIVKILSTLWSFLWLV